MCVYTTQSATLTTEYPAWKDYTIKKQLPPSLWLETPDYPVNERSQFGNPSPVIGIGNWGTIMLQNGDQTYWDWAQFAPPRSMWPGGKAMPYYNAKIETLEEYQSGSKKGPFPKVVKDDLQQRMCVFWVNSFFESNGSKSQPRWFHIFREDKKFIPLAGFYHEVEDADKGISWPGFTIITRDPYKIVAQTGHDRSPGILPYDHVSTWLNPNNSVDSKLSMLADATSGTFVVDEVERSNVTKRTDKAVEPIEGGESFAVGSL